MQALRTVPYISHKNGSVYQCVGIVSEYVNTEDNLDDQIGIITSPRGRVLFGPANIWGKGKIELHVNIILDENKTFSLQMIFANC